MPKKNSTTEVVAALAVAGLISFAAIGKLSASSSDTHCLVDTYSEINSTLPKKEYIDEYFGNQGNTNYRMKSYTSSLVNTGDENWIIKQCDSWFTTLKELIKNEFIELGESYKYFDFLVNLSRENNYSIFLRSVLLKNDVNIYNAILLFLSQKDYLYITDEEEKFVLTLLSGDDAYVQEFALNAILMWEKVSNKDSLKNIKLANRYLQEDLDAFLKELN